MGRMKDIWTPDMFGGDPPDDPPDDDDIVGMVHRPDHDTSEEAAWKVLLQRGTIKTNVMICMREHHPQALTDRTIHLWCCARFKVRPESSYRKRRTELTDEFLVFDTGGRVEQEGSTRILWSLTDIGLLRAKELG